jgi:hypothetical protein
MVPNPFCRRHGLRYKLSNYFALKGNATYGRVSGNDNLTTETFRHNRNLNFFSDIIELNVNFEAAFQQEQIGHRYRLRKLKGLRGYEIYMYGFAGVGIFYFNPKTEIDGHVYELQPLEQKVRDMFQPAKNIPKFKCASPWVWVSSIPSTDPGV